MRLVEPKRPDLLVEAFSSNGHSLTIIGDGPLFKDLSVRCQALSNICMKGSVTDWINDPSFHAFILLSDSEGLPMSAIEAMGAGMPLVLSDVGGCASLIRGNGCLVSNELEAVQAGISDIEANLYEYSQASRSYFLERFCLDTGMSHYIEFYQLAIRSF